ncbi:MAG: peroxiredoxin [Bdellovibrionales bacterium]|nr:peroxiredoxin [Bdellovibrionales bacterium]
MIRIGKPAPNFSAQAYQKGEFKEVSLQDYKGKWLVFFFYPLDFTFVCPTELRAFAAQQNDFTAMDAEILACSVDSVYSHKAWVESDLKEIQYPILSDMTKTISRDYGVLDDEKAVAHRGLFLIDPDGVVRYSTITDMGIGRGTDEVLRVLKASQSGELCPANWNPGDDHIKKA